ncbi:MAG: hypothetical protein HAW59_01000 [Betaproteobacteria bacterium]|nr:hypothetical protein [Betaproteobacteria bacterium]
MAVVKKTVKVLLSAPATREEWKAWRGLTAAFFAVCLILSAAILLGAL